MYISQLVQPPIVDTSIFSNSGFKVVIPKLVSNVSKAFYAYFSYYPIYQFFLSNIKTIRCQISYRYHQQPRLSNSNSWSSLRRRYLQWHTWPPSWTSLMLPPWNTSFRSLHPLRYGTATKTKRNTSMGRPWSCLHVCHFVCGSGVRVRTWSDEDDSQGKTVDGSGWWMGIGR